MAEQGQDKLFLKFLTPEELLSYINAQAKARNAGAVIRSANAKMLALRDLNQARQEEKIAADEAGVIEAIEKQIATKATA